MWRHPRTAWALVSWSNECRTSKDSGADVLERTYFTVPEGEVQGIGEVSPQVEQEEKHVHVYTLDLLL